MKITTICFLVASDQVLLAMKKRGFGTGKWNGPGGKVSDGETPERAVIREVEEETSIRIKEEDLVSRGTIKFSFKDHPDWQQTCHVFMVYRWEGEPKESEEMRPAWFSRRALPYDEMWVDDPYWLPLVLEGEMIEAEFLFENEGRSIASKTIRVVGRRKTS